MKSTLACTCNGGLVWKLINVYFSRTLKEKDKLFLLRGKKTDKRKYVCDMSIQK